MDENVTLTVHNLSHKEAQKIATLATDYGDIIKSGKCTLCRYVTVTCKNLQNAIQFVADISCDLENYDSPIFEVVHSNVCEEK